ncbi:alpha-L-glutamate ligase-like protein [Pelagicoccus mobilis]|uniref:Alpha-L-glutamate ligase-like protein n=1 Tax=Pelagicoccus mobilis TaxID=415221 RepID=A0A934RYA5_9BACT|nr:alpha-L-glutamate ligase-like protein [Pelagicoccus mobilis]MBK1878972.1 alpha-L-glutamate ligase-like protein [Pelagicoccus mobilis]
MNIDWLKRLKESFPPKLASVRSLRQDGVLGMNTRNHAYIQAYNDRKLYPIVDDKTQTKKLAIRHKIPTPDLIGIINFQHQVPSALELLKNKSEFVIKPAKGSAGKGILVISKREGDLYFKPSGAKVTKADLTRHISNILSGLYSLGGVTDSAMIEEIIQFTDTFDGYSYQGVPDIRIIVFKGYPVMAMSRLSTEASDGKANLHQGAVGVGIDLATGRARYAVQFDQSIKRHPDTGKPFDQLKIPLWDEHLLIATRCYEMAGLGYLGADVVLDRVRGPLILELNARPGLAIQTANGLGLQSRLSRIESLDHETPRTPEERVDFSKKEFAA